MQILKFHFFWFWKAQCTTKVCPGTQNNRNASQSVCLWLKRLEGLWLLLFYWRNKSQASHFVSFKFCVLKSDKRTVEALLLHVFWSKKVVRVCLSTKFTNLEICIFWTFCPIMCHLVSLLCGWVLKGPFTGKQQDIGAYWSYALTFSKKIG